MRPGSPLHTNDDWEDFHPFPFEKLKRCTAITTPRTDWQSSFFEVWRMAEILPSVVFGGSVFTSEIFSVAITRLDLYQQ